MDILQLPNALICPNRTKASGIEALCLFLRRHSYPCRYFDLVPMFGRAIEEMSLISTTFTNFIYDRWRYLLQTMGQPWLAPDQLEIFAASIHERSAAISNCFGFVDGSLVPICRPGNNQRIFYNGHKRVHAIKYQAVSAPNGLCVNLSGPYEGRKHDSSMLTESALLTELNQYSHDSNGNILCVYGDPAYPLRPQLMGPFGGNNLTQEQKIWNMSMSSLRVSVEWLFGDIKNYFKFIDFKKDLKIQLSAIGKLFIVCAIMYNARVCLYGSTTSSFLDLIHQIYVNILFSCIFNQ